MKESGWTGTALGLWQAGKTAGETADVAWQGDLIFLVLFWYPNRKVLGLMLHTFPKAFWRILSKFLKKIPPILLLHLSPSLQEKKEKEKTKQWKYIGVPRMSLTLDSYPGWLPVGSRKDSALRIVFSGLSLELSLPVAFQSWSWITDCI